VTPLRDVVEEGEHAPLEQRRGTLVVVGQAVVSEQMPIAGVQEQLCGLDCLGELVGDVEVAPLVALWIWRGMPCGQGRLNSDVGIQP
jgi:hypothetical protein